MPTYEFRCPDGHEFEKFYRTISGAESEAACPVCGKAAERFMSAAGFAFKGSGFYLTDYGKNAHRGEAPPKSGDAGGDSAPKESSGDSSKSDSGSSSGDSKPSSAGSEGAKSSDTATSAAKPEKKAEPKAAESKPAKTPPKPSGGE